MSTAPYNTHSFSDEESTDNGSHLTSAGCATVDLDAHLTFEYSTSCCFCYNDADELAILERFTSFPALDVFSAQDSDYTCSPATREHVLESIQRLFDNTSAEHIFWLHGPTGAGRSAMAQAVADANRQDKVAATFSFLRSDPSRNDGNRLFTTLAWQIVNSIPAIRYHISQSLKEHPDLPTRDVETQFEELIVRPLLASTELQVFVVIIDGIDECLDDKLQQRILKVIGTAVRNADFPLRFLISSRPEAHIEETINCFELPILRIDLASLDNANGDAEFVRITAEKDLEPTWPGQQILSHLVPESAEQFLCAAIEESSNHGSRLMSAGVAAGNPQDVPAIRHNADSTSNDQSSDLKPSEENTSRDRREPTQSNLSRFVFGWAVIVVILIAILSCLFRSVTSSLRSLHHILVHAGPLY